MHINWQPNISGVGWHFSGHGIYALPHLKIIAQNNIWPKTVTVLYNPHNNYTAWKLNL